MSEVTRAAIDDEEARIARRVRERAALQDQCIICLDGSPNIATLCCGQAVHLNCIAEWLSKRTTCVNCRSPLPRLNVSGSRQEGAASGAAPPRQENDSSVNIIPDTSQSIQNIIQRYRDTIDEIHNQQTILIQALQNQGVPHYEEFTTIFAAVDDDDSTSTVEIPPEAPRPHCLNCRNPSALDCENHMCANCCSTEGQSFCDRHGTPGPPSDDSSTTSTDNETPPTCPSCSNMPASGCRNSMCGVCCATHGAFTCQRHPLRSSSPSQRSDSSTTSTIQQNFITTPSWAPNVETSSIPNEVTPPPQVRSQPYCVDCAHNRAALDCANHMCGRCCVLGGLAHHCIRHLGM